MSELQTPDEGTEITEPVTQPENTEETETPQIPSEEAEGQQESTPEQSSPEPQPAPPEGYIPKDKFVASAQESILNAERVRVANARLESLTKQDTPTDEAMRLVYPEWDDLNDVTKKALVKQEAQEMRQRRIEARQQELDDRLKLEDQLETVIEDSRFSKLKGREAEFKRFAMKPANRGITAEVLAQAFLFDASEDMPAAPVSKTEALPQGSGGPREPLKPKKISLEEAKKIRETDNKRYMQLVKAGMIDDDV
jgi:hypothetical protein